MYRFSILCLMLIFPAVCAAIDAGWNTGFSVLHFVGKWFVFWAVGGRLLIAGVRQMLQPRFTAETILGIRGGEAQLVVRELGIANAALGLMGLLSLLWPGGLLMAATAGSAFYGLAGLNHALHGPRTRLQAFAMITDLLAGLALSAFLVLTERAGVT